LLHLYIAFLGTWKKNDMDNIVGIMEWGKSPQTPPMCRIHPRWCDGSHFVPECPPHTPAHWWRRDSDEANQYIWRCV